jgi:putative flippase GtrA
MTALLLDRASRNMVILAPGQVAQFARFCLVGLFCAALNIAMLAVLHEWAGLHYVLAYVTVFVLGNAVGYALNKRFTFARGSAADHAAMMRYLLVNLVALALSTLALHLLVERLHLWYLAAAIAVVGLSAPFTYLAQRSVTYRVTS